MTNTRPIYPPYHRILTALAERDGLTTRDLHDAAGQPCNLATIVEYGWLTSERFGGGAIRCRYHLTDLGRSVEASGLVEVPERSYHRDFTRTDASRRETPKAETGGCIHWWVIESTIGQPGRCRKCGTTKVFRPTFASEFLPVGTGRVTASERYPGVSS